MIYEDAYRFMLKDASAKEIDIMMVMTGNTDWTSKIRAGLKEIAKKAGTTKAYVKTVVKRFLSPLKGKHILAKQEHSTHPYILKIGKTSLLHQNGDRYCKKYRFFFEMPFQDLSIYAKRILLSSAWQVSYNGGQEVFLRVSDFLHRNEMTSGLIPSRAVLLRTLKEINAAFGCALSASLLSSIHNQMEYIRVNFAPDMLETVVENHTERKQLRRILFENGHVSHVSDDYCIGLEKTAKYLFNSMLSIAKDAKMTGMIDRMLEMSRSVLENSLARFAVQLEKLMQKGESPEAVSAYFSTVIFSVMTEEAAKAGNRADALQALVEEYRTCSADSIQTEINEATAVTLILQEWLVKWTYARVRKLHSKKQDEDAENIIYNNELLETIKETVEPVKTLADRFRGQGMRLIRRHSFLTDFLKRIEGYIDLMNERLPGRSLSYE